MNQEIIAIIVEIALLVVAVVGVVGILVAGAYDVLAIARRSRLRTEVRRLRKPRQPAVTVLVYVENDDDTITRCLQAVKRSSYRNYDVVVVDNVSHDDTRRAVRNFMKKHPSFPLRLYAKRKPVGIEEALRQGYQRSQKGELIVTLSGASCPPRDLIKSAVARFTSDDTLAGVALNERLLTPPSMKTTLPVLVRLGRHVAAKGLSLTGLRRDHLSLNGIYRESLVGAGRAKVRYESGLVLPVTRFAADDTASPDAAFSLPLGKLVLGLGAVLLMTYSMVTATLLTSSMPLIMGWLLVAIGGLAIVWSDEGLGMVQKIEQTICIPFVYFLAYAALVKFVLLTGVKATVRVVKGRPLRLRLYAHYRAIS